MHPGKGCIQEVMGLPPRSVTASRNPTTWGPLPVAFLKFLSQRSQVEAHGHMWPACGFCLACLIFFYNLNLNALGGEGRALLSKATRFPLPQPHSLSQVCVPGLWGHLYLTAPPLVTHPSRGCRPSVQYFSSGTGSRLLISASIKLFIREPQNCPVPRLTA